MHTKQHNVHVTADKVKLLVTLLLNRDQITIYLLEENILIIQKTSAKPHCLKMQCVSHICITEQNVADAASTVHRQCCHVHHHPSKPL